nr:formylmethanofuran dehydrogenase subunit C [Pseudaminobacter soli]
MTFTLTSEPPERLDLSDFTPQALAGLSVSEIETMRVGQSRRALRVADVFRISGEPGDTIIFEGGSSRLDGVGTGMSEGAIRVIGEVGARAGRAMRGGTLIVEGDCGPHAGSGMRGGRLSISGNAGDYLGAPLAGELAGMAGGVLTVAGRAGDFAGDRMRRGLIVVLEGAGDHVGCRMIAGTLVVCGGAGAMPGYLMRRGSILLDHAPASLSPSFVESGAPDSVFAALIDRYLVREGILDHPILGLAPRRFSGDNAVLGLGEIMFPG